MESVWLGPQLSHEIMKGDEIFKCTQSIVADIMSGKTDLTLLVENMAGVLVNKEYTEREKGMKFFTKLLSEIPKDYLSNMQIKFIAKFYTDRLKDHHKVIPTVLEGYLMIVNMVNYDITCCAEFFVGLFKDVLCQAQPREDRYRIYSIIQVLTDKDLNYMKTLGPDYIYGVISSIEGERDPRNLLFIFKFLPNFISNMPLGHLASQMFDVVSCYYPIDFHPRPDDPAAVTRQDLADALAPCLCASPEFATGCLELIIEKLDSSLRLAKLDSLKLLIHSTTSPFKTEDYEPFLKTLWSSLNRELSNKGDDELKMASHEALSALIKKLGSNPNTMHSFDTFVKGILITGQGSIANASTVAQFIQAKQILMTTANSSKESCLLVIKSMIPAIIAYYNFNTSPKLQTASLMFLGDMNEMAKFWDVTNEIRSELKEIPQLCLVAVSQPQKEYQIAGFKTLIRLADVIESDIVVALVEILIHNVQFSTENDLLSVSVDAIHMLGRKFPELIMGLVVKGKCDLDNLSKDKSFLQKRLDLLCSLASIDDFTKIIVEEMLSIVVSSEDADKVIRALEISMSNSDLYTEEKITQIECDHGLTDSVISWLDKELSQSASINALIHGLSLISNSMCHLPKEKQEYLLEKHTKNLVEKSKVNELYFLILESLYSSVHQSVDTKSFEEIFKYSLELCLNSKNDIVRHKACVVVAHFINKADYGSKFEVLYDSMKVYLASCSRDDVELCTKLITLYGWLTKALVMRGSDLFAFWLQKITTTLSSLEYCDESSKAIKLIMEDNSEYLTAKQHCRISFLYKQRMFQEFNSLAAKLGPFKGKTMENYMLCWAYVLGKVPKSILISNVDRIATLVIDSLDIDNKDLLLVMSDVLSYLIQEKHSTVASSLQTILPRLIKMTTYEGFMDVRMKSLQCLFDIAQNYPTVLLLPHKQDILLDLASSLDDKKRLVRNIAVKARTRWFLIGSPGESKEN